MDEPTNDPRPSSLNESYSRSVKIPSLFFTLVLIGLMWAGIGGGFIFAVVRFWESGGQFGSWSTEAIYFGIIALICGTILLSFLTIFLFKRIFPKVLDFIYLETKRREIGNLLEGEKFKHKKIVDKLKAENKAIKKRYHSVISILYTYAKKNELKELIPNEQS